MSLEKNFPRGGLKKPKPVSKKRKEKNLFQMTTRFSNKNTDNENKSELTETPMKSLNEFKINEIQLLRPHMFSESMNLLGIISSVEEHKLKMSLPGCLVGFVPVSNISHPCSDLLKKYMEHNTTEAEDHISLADLFSTGTAFICQIKSLTESKTNPDRNDTILSIDPRDVNSTYTPYDLKKGMTLQAAVVSLEDHGYIMDVGIKHLQGFLKTEDAENYILKKNNGHQLRKGKVLRCIVEDPLPACDGVMNVVNLSINPKKVSKAIMKKEMKINLNCLAPGMQVPIYVTKILKNGLYGNVWNHIGVVHKLHLEQTSHELADYAVDTQYIGTILYVHPLLKVLYLSLQPHLQFVYPKDLFPELKVGDELKGVVTEKGKFGVMLKINKIFRAICAKYHLRDKQVSSVYFKKHFPLKSEHRMKIVAFNNLDNVINVSMRKTILDCKYFSCSDLKPGQIVKCQVNKFLPAGIGVLISGTKIRGIIPRLHTADFPLKFPQKSLQIGQILECKVLSVNTGKNSVILTNKKTIVSSDSPVITSYDMVRRDDEVEGMVVLVSPNMLLVSLSGDVKGIITEKELKAAGINKPQNSFYQGQMVKCIVCHCNAQRKSLLLSLQHAREKMEIGKIYTCTVTKKNNNGLSVQLHPSQMDAFLPTFHLSDNFKHCSALLDMYQVGDEINNVVGFSYEKTNIISKKGCIFSAAQNHTLPVNWEDNKVQSIVPCVVKKQLPDNKYVLSTSHGWTGLAVIKSVVGSVYYPEGLPRGSSILAKIMKRNDENQKLKFKANLKSCWNKETTPSVELLVNYLEEKAKLQEFQCRNNTKKEPLLSVDVGSIVSLRISHSTKIGVAGHLLNNSIKAIATTENMKGLNCNTGETVSGIVLCVDVENDVVELSLDPSILKAVSKTKTNLVLFKEGQKVRAEVIDIKDHYVLAALKGFATGKFAYLPCRRHLNDFEGRKSLYSIGKSYKAVVKRILSDDFVIAVLEAHENSIKDSKDSVVKVGAICSATIKRVTIDQLTISFDADPLEKGRVFVTEILDNITDGTIPTAAFQKQQKIKVRVIQRKFIYSSKYIYECSLKPSVLKGEFQEVSETEQRRLYYPGSRIIGYIKEFVSNCLILNVTPTITGKIYFLNVSQNPKIVQNLSEYFQVGKGYNAIVVSSDENHLELTMTGICELKPDSVVNGEILTYQFSLGILFRLPFGYRGTVALTDLTDEYDSAYQILNNIIRHQILPCYVLSVNSATKEAVLSLRKSRLHSSVRSTVHDPEIDHVSPGDVLRGFVVLVGKNEKPTKILLGRNLHGFLNLNDDQKSQISKGDVVTVTVKQVNDVIELECSCLPKKSNKTVDETSPYCNEEPDEKMAQEQTTMVLEENLGQSFNSKRKMDATVETCSRKKQKVENFSLPNKSPKGENDVHSTIQQEQSPERMPSKKKQEITVLPIRNLKTPPKQSEDTESFTKKQKRNLQTQHQEQCTEVTRPLKMEHQVSSYLPNVSPTKKDSLEKIPRLEVQEVFTWEPVPEQEKKMDDEQSSSSSDEEEKKENENKKKKKKYDSVLTEEQHLYQKERLLADDDRQPQTVDDFDRLVLTSPNSSIIWLKYIAFHLQDAEVDKARAVAERALKTICFREEREKFNVWTGLLNLENLYGTEESLNSVLQRALQGNDPLRVYKQMIIIYTNTNKLEQAEQLYNLMLKKYKADKTVWIDCMVFHMRHNRLESARKILERALKSLPTSQHIDVISRFAQLEFKYGEVERGKTLFDQILVNFPRRTEIWSVYIDLVIKQGDIDAARNILDRVLVAELSVKQMKSMFKKALDFELKYGTEETVQLVKQKARDYADIQS